MRELFSVFKVFNVSLAFWFRFSDYEKLYSDTEKFNLDMASYGIVQMLGHSGKTYIDMPWEPRKAFGAMSEI